MNLIMETQTAIVLFALVAAFGLVTVVAVDIILTAQEADAVKPPTQGCRTSQAFNAS
jgi:Flp pilus assembly protein CpaB